MLRVAVDTCVIISAMDVDDRNHEACRRLFELAQSREVEIQVATAFDYDLEASTASERDTARHSWLDALPATRTSGPFRIGVSVLAGDSSVAPHGDVLVGSEQVELLTLVVTPSEASELILREPVLPVPNSIWADICNDHFGGTR